MTSDPYIDSLRNEIADLKAQNEVLRSQLLVKQGSQIHMIRLLSDVMTAVSDL